MPSLALGKITIHTFEPPPKGFDPLKASAGDLLRHGYPRRPDAEREPQAAAMWVDAMRRYGQFEYVTPEIGERPDHFHGPVRRTKDSPQHIANGTSFNWSGEVVFIGQGDSFAWIIGQWTVPHVYAVPGVPGTQYSSVWLGIDGDGSSDVMQAGTESDSDGTCRAWFEWFPDFEHPINNFPVAYGDSMSLLLCHTGVNNAGLDTAWLSFLNMTSKQSTSFTFTAPAGTTLVGNCAEAVVERPSVGGGLATLPRYGICELNDVTAYSKNGVAYPIATGLALSMVGNDATTVISTPDPEQGDADSFACEYTGP
jgi:hypothetical protein